MNCSWEYSSMGQPIGIRPGDIRETIWLLGIDETHKTDIFHSIRLMQTTALNVIAEQSSKT